MVCRERWVGVTVRCRATMFVVKSDSAKSLSLSKRPSPCVGGDGDLDESESLPQHKIREADGDLKSSPKPFP